MEQLNMFGCPSAYRSSRITRQTRRESNQQVQPRLTELVQDGLIEVVGKRLDSVTKRRVAVYRLIKD